MRHNSTGRIAGEIPWGKHRKQLTVAKPYSKSSHRCKSKSRFPQEESEEMPQRSKVHSLYNHRKWSERKNRTELSAQPDERMRKKQEEKTNPSTGNSPNR